MNLSEMTGFSRLSVKQFDRENKELIEDMEEQFKLALCLFQGRADTYDTVVGFRHKLAFGLVSAVSLIFEDASRLVALVRTDKLDDMQDKMLDMLNHAVVGLVLLTEELNIREDAREPACDEYVGGGITADRIITQDGRVLGEVEPTPEEAELLGLSNPEAAPQQATGFEALPVDTEGEEDWAPEETEDEAPEPPRGKRSFLGISRR